MAVGLPDNTLRAFRVEDGQQVLFQGSHTDWVIDTIFGTEGKYLVSVGAGSNRKADCSGHRAALWTTLLPSPQAPSGRCDSVRHPTPPFATRYWIGAADGTSTLYRMVRQTKRVIGDNANLVRRPCSHATGRVFGVDYSPDGKRITAASGPDG